MDCTAYLARIGYQGSIEPTLSVLRDLQRCHLYSVPFENLDIHLGVPIRLDLGDIYKKIVKQRRGGFCYELNGVYFELLRSLGFNASRVSARVFDREKGFGQEFDHLAIIVHLGKEAYLTDVGFGRFAMHPLQIRLDENQMDDAGTFVITGQSDGCFLVNQVKDDLTEPVYRFDPTPRKYEEFASMCQYHQSSPESHFTQKRFLTIATPNGRVSLVDRQLKVGAQTEEITSDDLYSRALQKWFGVELA